MTEIKGWSMHYLTLKKRKRKRKRYYQMQYPHDIKYPDAVHHDISRSFNNVYKYWYILYNRKHFVPGSSTAQTLTTKKMLRTLANRWLLTNV